VEEGAEKRNSDTDMMERKGKRRKTRRTKPVRVGKGVTGSVFCSEVHYRPAGSTEKRGGKEETKSSG